MGDGKWGVKIEVSVTRLIPDPKEGVHSGVLGEGLSKKRLLLQV